MIWPAPCNYPFIDIGFDGTLPLALRRWEPDGVRTVSPDGRRNDYRAADDLCTEGKAPGSGQRSGFAVRADPGATRMFEMPAASKLPKPGRACAGSELGDHRGFDPPSAIRKLQTAIAPDGTESCSPGRRVLDGGRSQWIGPGANRSRCIRVNRAARENSFPS